MLIFLTSFVAEKINMVKAPLMTLSPRGANSYPRGDFRPFFASRDRADSAPARSHLATVLPFLRRSIGEVARRSRWLALALDQLLLGNVEEVIVFCDVLFELSHHKECAVHPQVVPSRC
jgi:hypothetical protein